MKSFVAITVFLLQITRVHCLASGAPTSVCGTMAPAHTDIIPQTSASPYKITTSAATYGPNDKITVTIAATGAQTHGGLLVQARKSDDSSTTPIGTFMTPSANTKLMTCTTADNSWTHSAATDKTTSTVIWVAPDGDAGTVVFKATIAQNHDNYWLNQKSAELKYNSSTKSAVSCLLVVMCLLGLFM